MSDVSQADRYGPKSSILLDPLRFCYSWIFQYTMVWWRQEWEFCHDHTNGLWELFSSFIHKTIKGLYLQKKNIENNKNLPKQNILLQGNSSNRSEWGILMTISWNTKRNKNTKQTTKKTPKKLILESEI